LSRSLGRPSCLGLACKGKSDKAHRGGWVGGPAASGPTASPKRPATDGLRQLRMQHVLRIHMVPDKFLHATCHHVRQRWVAVRHAGQGQAQGLASAGRVAVAAVVGRQLSRAAAFRTAGRPPCSPRLPLARRRVLVVRPAAFPGGRSGRRVSQVLRHPAAPAPRPCASPAALGATKAALVLAPSRQRDCRIEVWEASGKWAEAATRMLFAGSNVARRTGVGEGARPGGLCQVSRKPAAAVAPAGHRQTVWKGIKLVAPGLVTRISSLT